MNPLPPGTFQSSGNEGGRRRQPMRGGTDDLTQSLSGLRRVLRDQVAEEPRARGQSRSRRHLDYRRPSRRMRQVPEDQ